MHSLREVGLMLEVMKSMQADVVSEKSIDIPICKSKSDRKDFSDFDVYGLTDLRELLDSNFYYLMTFRDGEFWSLDLSDFARTREGAERKLYLSEVEKSGGEEVCYVNLGMLIERGWLA